MSQASLEPSAGGARRVRLRFSPFGRKLFLFWLGALALFLFGWWWRPYTIPEPPAAKASAAAEERQHSGVMGVLHRKVLDRDDSWTPMRMAIDLLHEDSNQPLYSTIFARRIKFQYPPSSLLGVEALQRLFGKGATSNTVMNLLGILLWPLMFGAVYALCRPALPPLREAPLDHALPLLFAAICYPTLKSIELGQIQTHLNALFCLAVLLFVRGRTATAGVIIGVMATIKPQMGMFLLWAVIQKEYRFAKAMGGCAAIIGLVSLAHYGLAPHLEYLGVLSEISRRGESYYANQSLNGLLLRMLGLGPNLDFSYGVFAPYSPWVRYPTLISSLLLIGFALWPFRENGSNRGLAFVIAALCFTVGSPVAWQHHYGIAPALFAVCFVAMTARAEARSAWTLLGVAWVLIGTRIAAMAALAETPLNFLQSYTFFGALLLLVQLHRVRLHAARQASVAMPAPAQ